ncbi:MAG: mucoidy inhibitor MuiA family protein [Paludibacteraceae bacterium]|nr:mucoidy inhibitor MuiA family protein [Paludibacteraceae bacterium]
MFTFLLSAITSVSLFLNGAEINQTETLSLQKGQNEIRVEGLSPKLNIPSIQLTLGGGTVITSSQFITDYLSVNNADKDNLTLQLQTKQDELKQLQSLKSTLTNSLTLLQSGVEASISSDKVSTTTIDANLLYYKNKAAALQKELTQTEKSIEQTEQLIQQLKKQISEQSTKSKNRCGVLLLSVSSPKAQKQELKIKYFTSAASWSMQYDVNIDKIGQPIQLVKKAVLTQTTGLDWNKVQLTLSTAMPSTNNQVPTLSPWKLRFKEEYRPEKRAANTYMAKEVAAAPMEDAMMVEAEEETAYSTAASVITTTQQDLSLEYRIDVPYDVQGNGKEQIIALGEEKLTDIDFTYQVVPKYNTDVFLVAEIHNWSKLNLLDGLASVHYNGTFFGQTYLSASSVKENIYLTLGNDPAIQVKREQLREFTTTKTLGSTKEQTYAYQTTIRNTKSEPVNITVKDQYPVSAHKDIRVTLSNKTTAAAENNTEKGYLTYKLSLQPSASQDLYLEYTIKSPTDKTIR